MSSKAPLLMVSSPPWPLYLALGQSTISIHVKALERVLHARLIVYRERRVHLTTDSTESVPWAVR